MAASISLSVAVRERREDRLLMSPTESFRDE